jgi:NAD(P)-dependent dehydrogenase (short-subunit alcohol dehydrogenase family)
LKSILDIRTDGSLGGRAAPIVPQNRLLQRKEIPMSETTWFITGASSGLGYALAEHVLQKGERVAMGARTVGPMNELASRYPDQGLAVELDVTKPDQRVAAVQRCEDRFGSVDVLVNNAAIDFLGAVEEQDEAAYRATFEVNFFAPVELMRLVLPGMRSRKRGTIVNISSMDGIASVPVNGTYSASKFAIEGITETLWQEIEPLGLRAFLVEPGSFRTGIETRSHFAGSIIDDYEATSGRFRKIMENIRPEQFPGDPANAAAAIYQEVHSDSNRHHLILGSDAYRLIGAKLDALRSEFDAIRDLAFSTDYPDAGEAIL